MHPDGGNSPICPAGAPYAGLKSNAFAASSLLAWISLIPGEVA
jgi:hypothetical protein